MASTKSQIQALISQIQTNANYTASALNSLMNTVLDSIFSPFYSATTKPGSSDNQTQGFKAGSIGMDTSNSRVYACSFSTDSSATWEQITQDRNVSTIVATTGSAHLLGTSDTYIIYSGSQDGVTVYLPTASNSYLGKIVKVYFSGVSTSGSGVTFDVPELVPYTAAAANVYPDDSVIDLIFNGNTWAGYYSNPGGQDLQSVYDIGNDINTYQVRINDSSSDNLYIGKNDGSLSGNYNVSIGRYALNSYAQTYGIGIGDEAGAANTGYASISIGYQAGKFCFQGGSISIGNAANLNASSGANSISIGTNTGMNNTAINSIFIGNNAGWTTGGTANIMIGELAGQNASSSISNSVYIGTSSGYAALGSDYTISIGYECGVQSSGVNNIYIGKGAAGANVGSNSVIIGRGAGDSNSGNAVIALGNLAGVGNTISNCTIIANSSLPSYANNGAAVAALSGGASGNTYLYYNSTNNAIEGVRIP
jgi:hypothetical protein